jgi:uncharacterized protein with ATP-grasp and redox domains
MRTYLDCFPCFLSQALRAARIATDDEKKIKRVLDEIGHMLKDIPIESTPPESGRLIYHKISVITGNLDPYKKIKIASTQKALSLYPSLKQRVETSKNRLLTAIKIAIAGNVIDFGINWNFNLNHELEVIFNKDFAICDYDVFKKRLDDASEILYIGDNAGECVFDRILIEELRKPVIYAVRASPIINDATYVDALEAGIGQVATIVSSGTDAPGTVLKTCSSEFKDIYYNSGFIISKGQGNYEALSNEKHPQLFLLKAKCRVIADDIGLDKGDIALKGVE